MVAEDIKRKVLYDIWANRVRFRADAGELRIEARLGGWVTDFWCRLIKDAIPRSMLLEARLW